MSILPGLMPVIFSGIGTLSFFGSATSTAETVTAPANINAGDLLILSDYSYKDLGVPTEVIPTGFTKITGANNSGGDDNLRVTISYKIADGTEGGTSITGMLGDTDDKVLIVIRQNVAISSISTGDIDIEMTTGNPAQQVCAAGAGAAPLVVFATYAAFNSISGFSRNFSPSADAEINSSNFHYTKYKLYNSSPANITIDIADSGNETCLASFYLECS